MTTLSTWYIFSGKSHILEYEASLELGWIGYPLCNITLRYMVIIFSTLNCSDDPPVN